MARVKQVIQRYALGGERFREDAIIGFTTDENAWAIGENAAELHTAGWVFALADRPVPDLELAESVRVEGLTRRKPHPSGVFTWQCQGGALLIVAGVEADPAALDAYLSDYRTSEGRIDRARNASSKRAALICAELDANVPFRDAFGHHKLPSVRRTAHPVPVSKDGDTLAFYRSMIAAGDIED